jgi:hypothetical protein
MNLKQILLTVVLPNNINNNHLSQNKIARVTGLLRNGDLDLNGAITNVRHIHDAV